MSLEDFRWAGQIQRLILPTQTHMTYELTYEKEIYGEQR